MARRDSVHTTNYHDTLIEVAEDTRAECGTVPPIKNGQHTVASLQYAMIHDAPYRYTSDDVVFGVHADRQGIAAAERASARETFFARGQPCLRTSPLAKTYGWGVHSDAEGRIALVSMDSERYRALQNDASVTKVRAMRTRRA